MSPCFAAAAEIIVGREAGSTVLFACVFAPCRCHTIIAITITMAKSSHGHQDFLPCTGCCPPGFSGFLGLNDPSCTGVTLLPFKGLSFYPKCLLPITLGCGLQRVNLEDLRGGLCDSLSLYAPSGYVLPYSTLGGQPPLQVQCEIVPQVEAILWPIR